PAKQHKDERLIAILAGSHGVILGDWDVDVRSGYGPNGDVFPLVDPADDDPRKIKGMRLVGVSGQSGRVYSDDLRGGVILTLLGYVTWWSSGLVSSVIVVARYGPVSTS